MASLTDQKLDDIMGCECDAPVKCLDTYFLDEDTLVTVFICSGCGRQIHIHSDILKVYDVRIQLVEREDDGL